MASANRIIKLSSLIAQQTTIINNFFEQRGLPTPSLDPNALHLLPILDEACSELKALITGPRELLKFNTAYVSVKAILRFKLDKSFAVGEATSFEAMSKFSGLKVKNARRIVRHAIINHRFFQENISGVITHSALTSVLALDEMARNSLVVELDEFWPAGENNETGFALANNSNKGMFDIFANNQYRADRFGRYFSKPDPDPTNDGILENYPWGEKATMVDVGGSHGNVAINIAETFPNMKCIVQDLPDTVVEGASYLPKHMQGRVAFMAHDFFHPQPVTANADKYCIKILQNLVPALRPGARIVIHERILPGLENLDVEMQQLLNALQREMHEWPELFRRADPRFRYLGTHKPEGAIRWIIEAE
ncbi:S-adenosyl-L-methionine-dependent methyltransferase [Xylaria sp. FL0043]|nr:S-adenosyl-L-methionine-dependent methyltransferase [Xylaria sp. FL0043]